VNIRKFFAVFFITTALLFMCVLGAGYAYVSSLQIGEGGEIAELDTHVEKHERKNVLVVGSDKSGVLADVIMIFSFSDEKDPVNVVSIQRDTEVMVDGLSWKINSTYQLGLERFVGIIKDITDIPIHDYIVVNFKAVENVIDLLGGVDFDVPQDMDYEDPFQDLYIHLRGGYQHLNGNQSLQLLRFRGYPMADIQRTKVQRDFIMAVFRQKVKPENISKIEPIFNAISKNIKSSLNINEVLEYAGMAQGVEMNTYPMPCILNGYGGVIVDRANMYTLAQEHFVYEESNMQVANTQE